MDIGQMLTHELLFFGPIILAAIGINVKRAMDRRELNQLVACGRVEEVKGVITGLHQRRKGRYGTAYDFVVSYTTLSGLQLCTVVRSPLSKAKMLPYIGTQVVVIYNPAKPKNAIARVPTVPQSLYPTEEKLRERDEPRLQ